MTTWKRLIECLTPLVGPYPFAFIIIFGACSVGCCLGEMRICEEQGWVVGWTSFSPVVIPYHSYWLSKKKTIEEYTIKEEVEVCISMIKVSALFWGCIDDNLRLRVADAIRLERESTLSWANPAWGAHVRTRVITSLGHKGCSPTTYHSSTKPTRC